MGEKCTFGTRAPIEIHMLNEIIYREMKHFHNYKHYRPNFGAVPVTGKFYSRSDQTKDSEDELAMINTYHEKVSLTRAKGPHSKYPAPATDNQIYGWYYKPLVPLDRSDYRFYKPKRESIHTKTEILIRTAQSKNK